MTTPNGRRSDARRVVLRWTRTAIIALVAALAVLVHHETAAPMTHTPSSQAVEAAGMDGMDHGSVLPTSARTKGPVPLFRAAVPIAVSGDGVCSGMAMQHCSTASVDTVKLVPPAGPAIDHVPASASRVAPGRDVPGTISRAPPDLSLLSRLLL